MASSTQLPTPIAPRPEQVELVTREILRLSGLNTQAFSGSQDPSSIYSLMVQNSPAVYPFYREIEEKDTAVDAAISMRRQMVLARGMEVQTVARDGPAAIYGEALGDFLDAIPKFGFALWELLDAPAYGFAVCEILWGADGSRVWVDKILGRPQELFRFGKLFFPQTEDLMLSPTPGGQGAPVPQQKFLVNTYHPRHADRRGLPILRRLFWPSWFKRNVIRLWLHFLEKGPGTVAVQYPANADAAEKQNALAAATAIAQEIAVAVPDTFAMFTDLLEKSRTRHAEDFHILIDKMDAEMTRQVLGQTLTTRGSEEQRGAMALGVIHEQTMWQIVRSDAADLEDVINEQLCAPWLLWTFGPQALDPQFRPWWTVEKDPPKDAKSEVGLLQEVHSLVDIPTAAVYEAAQLKMPQEGEAIVPRAAVPVSLFKPGQ